MAYAPFPLIDLSGSPTERGRQHGRAAPDRIKRGIAMYSESLLKNGVEWKELERRAEAMVPTIEAFDATYVDEMRGIAEGSGERSLRRHHADERAHRDGIGGTPPAGGQAFPRRLHRCRSRCPRRRADGVLLHGQNWDWRTECAETGVVLRIRRDDGPDVS